ncbi:NPC intracellular cholesterol transporter 2 [Topomyia yanbarensis]|uniref:NPC intracellular cholesterol transporter 2 n=1 Tax=Topomyia yanbarensis TaxID=2498891 RepID=UPI00273A7D24|nr:NPC intracellular cholesterol transporter 2 [Topomyia yanbarensis]
MKCIIGIVVIFGLLAAQTSGVALTNRGQRWPWFRTKSGLPVEDCGATYDILSVQFSSCSNIPCVMPRGTDVTVVAEFSATGASALPSLKHEVYFVLNYVKTKATVTPAACEGAYCPLQGDIGLRFTAALHVSSLLPALRGTLHWELRNDNKDVLLCYEILITIR